MKYQTFCGGIFETNCYLVEAPEGEILFDAPDGACAWLETQGAHPKLLLLTHGHFDHVPDVAKIKQRFKCQIGCHPETAPMISDPEFFRSFGFELEIEPASPDFLIEATPARDFLGLEMEVLEVPGHCPGSLCFLICSGACAKRRAQGEAARKPQALGRSVSTKESEGSLLIGGDVLFAGGVGRWDLPHGDGELLFRGIKTKLFPLGDDVTVLPGHGPPTTIGRERKTNPFVH